MKKEIIINCTMQETRLALLENNVLAEILVERRKDRGILGNIYKGRVLKVLPGMQAAFVDIGLPKAGFLYVADIQEIAGDYDDLFLDEEREEPVETEEAAAGDQEQAPRIEEMLRQGQEIIVQVSKEPLGTKGARLTNRVALPGRYLVFLPWEDHVGISRRIVDEDERVRLRSMIQGLKPAQGGLIVRTVGEGAMEEEFSRDLDFLQRLWKKIREKGERAHAPHLIHMDLDLVLKTVRDYVTEDVDRVLVDSAEDRARIVEFVNSFLPPRSVKVELYRDPEPIFEAYDIELEIGKILEPKVWLKSGGYINIDFTEALISIDVNTGRFVGRADFEETVLKTNLEAAREIAYQLRLRNLGGIVIIDFIDMEKEKNRERVFKALEEALRNDRATTKILQISELGLVEMTRKRSRPPLERSLCQPCPYCKGRGLIRSIETVSNDIIRELVKAARGAACSSLLVEAHPLVADNLLEEERHNIDLLEKELGVGILIKANPAMRHEEFAVVPMEKPSA